MTAYSYPATTARTDYLPVLNFEINPSLLTLEAVCQQQRILPAYSLVLGLCEDQLPLVLDLTEPTTGSLLIAGDSGFANTTMLHSILTSAFLLNTESEVNIHLISPQADSLTHFHNQRNFKISYQPERKECEIVLEEMTSLIESRQQRSKSDPIHVLFIDSLDILWNTLSPQARIWLNWITTYGPQHGMMVIGTLETDYLSPRLHQLVDCFPSRIMGSMRKQSQARYLAGINVSNIAELTPELEYITVSDGASFRIQLLPSENDG
ncbi:MAG: hypothetical protein ABFS17_00905 [Chloroflexota bacterium]